MVNMKKDIDQICCSNLDQYMIVNFLSGSKVYIVEPLTILRNTNMDLNFTFTVGWGWVGGWINQD